jgi:hypothetical protein
MATPTTLPASFVSGAVLTAAQQNALRGAFRVLQVVSTAKTDTFTTASTSFTDVTGLSVSITPQSSSSKILVLAQVNGADDFGVSSGFIRLSRDTTAIDIGDTAGSRIRASAQFSSPYNGAMNVLNLSFLDSPATTTATTYKIQAATWAGTLYINRSKADTDSTALSRGASTITVMEISA